MGISRLIRSWRGSDSGALHVRLSLLFLLTAGVLITALGAYWLLEVEPRLRLDARSSASALAESHARNLGDLIARSSPEEVPRLVGAAADELMVLTDAGTGEPFVLGFELRLDYDVVPLPPGSVEVTRGSDCPDCFVDTLPVYAPRTGEIQGIATFRSSNAFFLRLRGDVRQKLAVGSVLALLVLVAAWRVVDALFRRLQANEDAAQQAARSKSEFLATMSHEIRTPMNGILGMVRLLQGRPLDPVCKDYVDTIAVSGSALLALLNDILDLSRAEAAKLQLEPEAFEPRRLVGDVCKLMTARAQEKGLVLATEVGPEVPPWLWADAGRLRQILLNLVGNAIKFTNRGSVTVRVAAHRASGVDWFEVAVIDTGKGIAVDQQAVLFEPFTQLAAGGGRHHPGSGLGLAICRRLVEAMDGVIGVRSAAGAGSTFYFRLPLRPASAEQVAAAQGGEAAGPAAGPGLAVLVADDSPINRRVAAGLLRSRGHRVEEVGDGRAAVERVARERFDVVLMDLHMPELDGLAASRLIRALPDPAVAAVTIIALSADVMPRERHACREAGMDGFVAKPFELDKLEGEMVRLLRARRAAYVGIE